MNYPLFLARRLSLGSSGKKSAPAVQVAIIAVALSIAVMLGAIAVVKGFKQEIRDKVVGFNSDMILYADSRNPDGNILTLDSALRKVLDSQKYISGYYLELSMPAIIKTPDDFKGIYYKGVGKDADLSFLKDNLVSGKMPELYEWSSQVLLSELSARKLRLEVGDTIDTYFIGNDINARQLVVSGLYNSHFDNYDDLYVYGNKDLVRSLADLSADQGTSLRIATDSFDELEHNAAALRQSLDKAYSEGNISKFMSVDSAMETGAAYFNWLGLLDTNVVVIIVLMTIVACITLVSGVLIIILDKTRLIGVLKALGATNAKIAEVFIYLAVRISLVGLVIGNVLMLTLLYVQQRTHFIPLDPESYYIDFVPVNIQTVDVLLLNLGVLAVIFLSLIVPSRFVSRISPDKTMRYE